MRGLFFAFILVSVAAAGWFCWRVATGAIWQDAAAVLPGDSALAADAGVAKAGESGRGGEGADMAARAGEAVLGRQDRDDAVTGQPSGRLPHGRGSAGGAKQLAAGTSPREAAPGDEPSRSQPDGRSGSNVRWPRSDPAEREAMRMLETAEAALAIDADHPEALRDKAGALRALDRPSEAADAMERLVRVLPDSAADRLEYGSLLAEQSRWQAAVEQFDALVRLLPDDARAWHNLAAAHQALGHLQDARQAWDRVIELAPDAAAYACRAEIAADMRDWLAAAADYEAARRLDPADADAGVNLAWAWSRLGREQAAKALLLELLEAHPSHVPIMNRLAELAWRRALAAPGDGAARDETAKWCRRSLRIDPAQPEVEALLKQVQSERRP